MRTIRNLIAGAILGFGALVSSSLAQTTTAAPGAGQDNTRAVVSQMLADAESRSALAGPGATAGHDDAGFFLAGDNGFRLNIGGDLQFRYTANFNDFGGSSSNLNDDYTGGFSLPLTRIRATGTLNTSIDFAVEGDFNRSSGQASLKDAYFGINGLGGNWRFGQFKLPFLREQLVSDRYQLAADRSVVASIFSQDRSQGVQATYDLGNLRIQGAFSDGFKTLNTDFTDASEADYALTGRVEYLVSGDRANFKDFTSVRGQQSALLVGGAFHIQDGKNQDRFYAYTGDISYKNGGWNLFASGVGRTTSMTGGDFNDYGVTVQGGYRVTDQFEPFARYEVIFADSARNLATDDYNFVTAGFNYYMVGHAAKFTLDGVWSLDETSGLGSLGGFSNTNLIPSTDKNEVVVRAQFQVLF